MTTTMKKPMAPASHPEPHTQEPRLNNLAPAFRDAMAELAGGVCVITTLDGTQPTGLTVTSGFSVSMTPALFAVCVANTSRSLTALLHTNRFVANVLNGQSAHVANNFASSKVPNKFVSAQGPIKSLNSRTGLPWLYKNSQAGVECEIDQVIAAGDHTLIIGHVIDVLFPPSSTNSTSNKTAHDAGGLAYLKREFHGLRSAT